MSIASTQSAVAIGFTFPILGAIFVALRFYSRWHLKTLRQIDDWLCIPAWFCLTGCCASLLTGVFGNAFDGEEVSDPGSVTEPQRLLAQTTGTLVLFYLVGNALVKLSFLFFYRRIFIGRAFSACTWIAMGATIVWLLYSILAWLLYCGANLQANFEGGWAVCPAWGFEVQIAVFVVDSVIDLAVLILPIPFVWKLQLNLSRKIAVALVFMLGGLAFVASLNNTIIQLVFLLQPETITDSTQSSNSFFQGPALFYSWPPVELGIGLIACNLPSLSFRVANSLPRRIRRGWDLSLFGLRHAAAKLSLRSSTGSDPRSTSRVEKRTGNTISSAGTALHAENERRSGRSGSIGSETVVEAAPFEGKVKRGEEQEEEDCLEEGVNGRVSEARTAGSHSLSDAPLGPPPLELAGEGRFIDECELMPRVEYFLDPHSGGRA